jgi:pyruvate dehydrogenase E1 component alpha subunit
MEITTDTKLHLLREMLKIRLFEEKICELYPAQEMRCPVHLSIGQEATSVGMCLAMRPGDLVFGNHRSHGHYIAKGGSLSRLMAEIYGKQTGCSRGIGGSMHLIDREVGMVAATPIIGGAVPVAMGAALAHQIRGEDTATVLFLGDAAIEEGVFHETINLASTKKLPLIFFCENNFFSVYTPLSARQPDRRLERLAAGHAVEALTLDGNNILEVFAAAQHALTHVRAGKGPVFIEAMTYRWREHCGVYYDNDLGYRAEADFLEWKTKCPLARFEKSLRDEGILSDPILLRMEEELDREIIAAVEFAKASPFLELAEVPEYLYVNSHA